MSLLLPFRIGFGIVGTYKWLVVWRFVTWGGVLLVWNLGNFNSAVCDALVGCVGTCIVVTVREMLYRLICSVGCCSLLFYYLGMCVPKFMSVRLLFMGWCLLRLLRFFWFGSCVCLSFSPKHRVLWALNYGYPYIVLVGCWLWIVIGVWHDFSFLSRLMRLEECEIEEGHAHPLRRK